MTLCGFWVRLGPFSCMPAYKDDTWQRTICSRIIRCLLTSCLGGRSTRIFTISHFASIWTHMFTDQVKAGAAFYILHCEQTLLQQTLRESGVSCSVNFPGQGIGAALLIYWWRRAIMPQRIHVMSCRDSQGSSPHLWWDRREKLGNSPHEEYAFITCWKQCESECALWL